MNQGPTQSARESSPDATVEFFRNFKKEIASYLAQKISFSLFHKDKYPLLRKRITELVDEKLAFSKTKLEPEDRDRLITEIFDGLPKGAPAPSPQEDSFSKLQNEVLSHLAQRLPNGLNPKIPKAEAAATLAQIVNAKLAQYPHLDKGTHRKILEKTLDRFDSGLAAFLPSEENTPLPPGEEIPVPPDPESELQRDVIYFLATNMDPSVFTNPQPETLRNEIDRVLQKRPDHQQRPVSAQLKESILVDIMAKGTIEFQL